MFKNRTRNESLTVRALYHNFKRIWGDQFLAEGSNQGEEQMNDCTFFEPPDAKEEQGLCI